MYGFISLLESTSYDKNNFMACLHERMLLNPRIEFATVCTPVGRASDRSTGPGIVTYDFDF